MDIFLSSATGFYHVLAGGGGKIKYLESHAFEAAVLSKSEGDAQVVVRVVRNFKDVYIEGRIPLKLNVYVVYVFAL